MKTKTLFILGLLMLFTLSSVQANPIVEISVDDTWEYTGTETYNYTVIDKQDFASGEEYVELIKIESSEVIEALNPSLSVVLDGNFTLEFDLQANVTSYNRWHTARGNFLAIIEKDGTFILDANINGTYYQNNGTFNYRRYYANFDLQSPLITGNPIYAERITIWQLDGFITKEGFLFKDITTYRIDGTDEFVRDYQGTPTTLRNVTIVPHDKTRTFMCAEFKLNIERPFPVTGMTQYLWVFANDIGLPIYKETSTVQATPMKLALTDVEGYDLTAFAIALSNFVPIETNWFFLGVIGAILFLILKRRRN